MDGAEPERGEALMRSPLACRQTIDMAGKLYRLGVG
jgi:hypothetical protein